MSEEVPPPESTSDGGAKNEETDGDNRKSNDIAVEQGDHMNEEVPSPQPDDAAQQGENGDPQQGQQEEPQQKPQRQAVVAPLPLDWTRMAECTENQEDENPANAVRYPWDVIQIDPTETDLSIVGTAGQKITRMGSNLHEHVSKDMTHLVLRSHLIRTMEGIRNLKKLELLELYDNIVDELNELDGSSANGSGDGDGLPGKNLRVLDISYNVIRDMGPVSLCPNLQELYIAQNKIKSITGIKHLKLLRKIDLGANRIRTIPEDELSSLENLEELWLGKNKIEQITGLSKLTKLRRLDVQSNRLTKIENLEAQVDTLEELYLAHNGIDVDGAKCPSGLALPFTNLNTIDMSRNRLTDASPFGHLATCLTDLWISGNQITTFEDIEPLQQLTELDSVYLEYNPVASEFEYRKKLAEMIPSLTQIDANMIGGIAQHGYGYMSSAGAVGGSLVERMRVMQDAAIEKAKKAEEEEEKKIGGGGDESEGGTKEKDTTKAAAEEEEK
mmetsp:Transcript_5243/g.11372  ORF Transcript_5243/g.11372 Transcript_5243/m.11372 type:complete len:500 (+) Transcript_5243:79-1578(+)